VSPYVCVGVGVCVEMPKGGREEGGPPTNREVWREKKHSAGEHALSLSPGFLGRRAGSERFLIVQQYGRLLSPDICPAIVEGVQSATHHGAHTGDGGRLLAHCHSARRPILL
jgi:hypothetical protein